MALFENLYKAAARTELGRRIRDLEEKDKSAQTAAGIRTDAGQVTANVDFARDAGLIDTQDAEAYRKRVQAAVR